MAEVMSTKRARASGEVLDFLLLEFERNANPSPEMRKDISKKTGMNEKAVRIWFQNRRAKLRKFERMSKSSAASSVSSKEMNRKSAPQEEVTPKRAFNLDSSIPIAINEKYCFLDCSSLSVGSWQRIKSGYHDEYALKNNLVNLSPFTLNNTMTNVDLLVILSRRNSEINYFFSAISNYSKILFRIFYPVSSILTCSTVDNNINKDHSELRLSLSHRPKFSVYFFNSPNSTANQWSICDDFSEGQQVSQACYAEKGNSTPHVLVGVKNSLQYLNAFILENNSVNRGAMQSTPPDSAISQKYYTEMPFEDPVNHGNLQFVNDNQFWDDVRPETPATTVSALNAPFVPSPSSEYLTKVKTTTSVEGTPLSNVSSHHRNTPQDHIPDDAYLFSSFDHQFEQPQYPSTRQSSESDHNSPSVNSKTYTHTSLPNNYTATFKSGFDLLHNELDFLDEMEAPNSSACSSNVDNFIDFGSH